MTGSATGPRLMGDDRDLEYVAPLPPPQFIEPEQWTESGECANPSTDLALAAQDADWWFAEPGTWRADLAKRVCSQCPVQLTCLAEAKRRQEEYGIWGGQQFQVTGRCGNGHEKTPQTWVQVTIKGRQSNICRECRRDQRARHNARKAEAA